ncbi:HAMP domain-containing sensor histidine kinase [Parasphingorhabdus sp.]|uniref:sensor histidine kinase n=1 Tax=Parasphingorhabdus sp. TaxID=2709688 RepID=UPI003265422A
MTASGKLAEPVCGQVDADGLLLSADPPLMTLHLRCGGSEGGALAVPELADLCRLSRRLGMNLSRPVQASNDDYHIDMWVETQLVSQNEEKHLSIAIVDWKERPRDDAHILNPDRERDFDRLEGRGTIRTDAALRVISQILPGEMERASEVAGQSLFDIFDVIPLSDHTKLLEAVAERQPIRNQRLREKRGDQRMFLFQGHPLIDKTGLFAGYRFAVTSDESAAEAGKPNAVRGKLISDSLFGLQLGPALRQPLGKIIANAETINSKLEGPLRGDYAGYAKDIASAGRHLLDLVNDLSDLEAIERPEFTVAADDIDLADLAHRAAGLLAVKAADHQIRIDLPDEDIKVPARGEFRRSLQVLVNLIGNAIRYSPDGSVVTLRAFSDKEFARISVSDQGDGIAGEDHDRIFEKFERLGRSGDGGSGLGLFISRRLARAMDGSLTVESVAGKGATFTLSLPSRKNA